MSKKLFIGCLISAGFFPLLFWGTIVVIVEINAREQRRNEQFAREQVMQMIKLGLKQYTPAGEITWTPEVKRLIDENARKDKTVEVDGL